MTSPNTNLIARAGSDVLAVIGPGVDVAVTATTTRFELPLAARGYRLKAEGDMRVAFGDDTVIATISTGSVLADGEVIEARATPAQTHLAVMGSGTLNLTVLD